MPGIYFYSFLPHVFLLVLFSSPLIPVNKRSRTRPQGREKVKEQKEGETREWIERVRDREEKSRRR